MVFVERQPKTVGVDAFACTPRRWAKAHPTAGAIAKSIATVAHAGKRRQRKALEPGSRTA